MTTTTTLSQGYQLKLPRPVTIDFETHGIQPRPSYPPVPVGVSIKYPGKKARYYAFGHPEGNTCCWSEAQAALTAAWAHPDGVLCQNGKFDLDVAETHFQLPLPAWDRLHDTMFLLFLDDPHQQELGLKPSAARLLNLPPEEQDAVAEWLITAQPIPGVKISRSRISEHYFARYLCYAPGELVGTYANGDVKRTEQLFNLLWPRTQQREMLKAYDRERQLMPVLLEMERQGLPVHLRYLRSDVINYRSWAAQVDTWILRRLRVKAEINLDSGEQLVAAMVAVGCADSNLLPRTPTGKYQTNKEALLLGVTDKVLLGMLKYRTQLSTCLRTFMEPWLLTAQRSGGLIFTTWNQVKGDVGTRTGRLSSTPNFQNIPKEFVPIFAHEELDKMKAKLLPVCPLEQLPSLPRVRSYITPFKGEVLVDRDWSQQEPRILAHFDGGQLMAAYNADPWLDLHDYAKAELEKMGKFYARKPVKNTNLGLIYGMGAPKLAMKNDMTVDEAKELKAAILTLYPGLKEMYQDMRARARTNVPIRTWGGREYFCEPPRLVDGRIREFDYKLVNVLIQGSAADATKETLIRLRNAIGVRPWRLLLNVHDQITMSVPRAEVDEAMAVMKQVMEGVEFDVPMLSEGSTSAVSWEELKAYDKKGVRCK